LILSYLTVFIVATVLLKYDAKTSLSRVLHNYQIRTILIGVLCGLMYLGTWYSVSFVLGSQFEFVTSTLQRDYGTYTFSSFPIAFILYLGFAVFGAFAEEMAYRGYVLTRVSTRYGSVVGILISTLVFALQHIHVFQTSWLIQFFQKQFIHVFLFSIVGGYLYVKSKDSIWSVFSMHALINAFSVAVPIVVTPSFVFANLLAETVSFVLILLLLRFIATPSTNNDRAQL
jgi:membrane protease YdiL (CAAX protease family)